jgi:vanillate O-demethylase monooxygenase subunit
MNKHRMNFEQVAFENAPSTQAIEGFYAGMRKFWHPVLRTDDLPIDKPIAVELLGTAIVLARLDGEIRALRDVCRHFQARLSLGEVVDIDGKDTLQCPYHGWAYGGDGKCARIPQLPEGRRIPPTAFVPSYLVEERYGVIWVCLEGEPRFPLPDYPEWGDQSFRTVTIKEEKTTRTSATRMIMGTLDDTHFPWVHEGILGERDKPEPPDHKVWREDGSLVLQYDISQPPNYATTDVSRLNEDDTDWVRITYTDYVSMPNTIRLIKDGEAGRYVIWLSTCANSYNKTTNFWAFSRNYDMDPAQDKTYEEFAAHVRSQDKPIIESQRPWLIPPFWSGIEMPLAPGDLPLVEYQKWLEELEISLEV